MTSQLRPAVVLFVGLTLITGVGYPLAVTGIARIAFREQAGGSLITVDGRIVGSELIAQPFTDPKYFWPRPSAANYDATAGSGSNLGPSNPALVDAVRGRVAALRAADPGNDLPAPADLVTASGSGLDPHISLAAALFQLRRVARARGLTEDVVAKRIEEFTDGGGTTMFGQPRVNVLLLNLALDHPGSAREHAGGHGLPEINLTRWPMTTH